MTNPIQLYRSILRQCTYLPDPASRSFFKSHVRQRFDKARLRFHRKGPLETKKLKKLFKHGFRMLSLLSRAACGYKGALDRVLEYTYGRAGPRRRALLADFRKYDGLPRNECEVQNRVLSRLAEIDQPNPVIKYTDRLEALATAIKIKGDKSLGRRIIRTLQPEVPQINNIGRPMPSRRIPNIIRALRADFYDKLVLPLPRLEIQRVQSLADGAQSWKYPERRSVEGCLPTEAQKRVDKKSMVRLVDAIANSTGSASSQRSRVKQDQLSTTSRPHRLTNRYMMRAWSRVLTGIPLMEFEEQNNEWVVSWYSRTRGWSAAGRKRHSFGSVEARESLNSNHLDYTELDRTYFPNQGQST